MSQARPENLEPVAGEEVEDSILAILKLILFMLVLLPVGGFLVCAWWTELDIVGRRINMAGGILGAIGFLSSVVLVPLLALSLFFKNRLIIGADRLQQVHGKGRVSLQIPYANISKIELVNKPGEDPFIGIDLKDVDDPETYCRGFATVKKLEGWHYRYGNTTAKLPVQQVYDHVLARYQEFRRTAG
jgi:hypothetical protein